jgi:hypothetical protein
MHAVLTRRSLVRIQQGQPFKNKSMTKRGPKPQTREQRIAKFNGFINKTDGCWEWQGSLNRLGYGRFTNFDGRRDWLAHRLSYRLFIGEFDEELRVCHSCDNPRCVNPNHLFLGTAKDNTQDSIRKGRFKEIKLNLRRKQQTGETKNNGINCKL